MNKRDELLVEMADGLEMLLGMVQSNSKNAGDLAYVNRKRRQISEARDNFCNSCDENDIRSN